MDKRDLVAAHALLTDHVTQRNLASINAIGKRLTGRVKSEDLDAIEDIYDRCTPNRKDAIRAAIEPKTHGTFWRKNTRERVREIIEAP